MFDRASAREPDQDGQFEDIGQAGASLIFRKRHVTSSERHTIGITSGLRVVQEQTRRRNCPLTSLQYPEARSGLTTQTASFLQGAVQL